MRRSALLLVLLIVTGLLVTGCLTTKGSDEMQDKADVFLKQYLTEFDKCWYNWTMTEWDAATTGADAAFEAHAKAELEINQLHSDAARYEELMELLKHRDQLSAMSVRSLELAELKFKGNQLPSDILEDMANRSSDISQVFNTFRGSIDGQSYSNNELLDMLSSETSSEKRQEAWAALKQVGDAVGPKLVELARVRNTGAVKLGYKNFWDMKIRLQEHDPEFLMTTFAQLEEMTNEPFRQMKTTMDAEIARKLNVEVKDLKPWHYDNPFFQAAPPSEAVDLDEFYKHMAKEDITALAIKFFGDIGLPIEDIVERSDLYEREGKDQHAFCEDMDRKGDVRTLCNIRPTAEWMDTMLHENGHATYDKFMDRDLPFNVRQANHIFTTEAVAMLFGSLAKTPSWIVAYAGADQGRVDEVKDAILEQRRREQLIFCRWTLVMLNFEKAMYENPDQDLNTLWWDYVERFQYLTRPADRSNADWAAKPHFTIAPVYYHNYQLGELFAAQLRATLAKLVNHEGPTNTLSFNGRKEFGTFLKEEIFAPGRTVPWPEFAENATGEPLSAKFFAEELK